MAGARAANTACAGQKREPGTTLRTWNRRCKLSGLWFSGTEWRRLCKGSQPRYGTEKVATLWRATKLSGESCCFGHKASARAWAGKGGEAVPVVGSLAPAEVTTLDELQAAQRFNIPFVIPKPDQPEQPLEMVTLRDRFAMAALTGFCANSTYRSVDPTTFAKWAFCQADECMKQRKAREADNGKASS